jgi:hypothetical protein
MRLPRVLSGAVTCSLAVPCGCGGDGGSAAEDGDADASDASGTETGVSGTETASGDGDADGDGAKFDVGDDGTGTSDTDGMPSCKVIDDMDAIPECDMKAPPDSFEPQVQWSWPGQDGYTSSFVTPLVANFTDDDDNGEIDLCDVPDVLVTAFGAGGRMFVLDGATGTVHFAIEDPVSRWTTPAIGDIDGDGQVEIVAAQGDGPGQDSPIVAFEHDGTPKWTSSGAWDGPSTMNGSLSIADLDNDGQPEIVAGNLILDHDGATEIEFDHYPNPTLGWRPSAATAHDLDGDEDLEVVLGVTAYHHDGSIYYQHIDDFEYSGFPQVGDLDDDGQPEILLTTKNGISMLEHDGSIKLKDVRPTGDDTSHLNWSRPAAIHDFDGDGAADFALSSGSKYSVYRGDASIVWTMPVSDLSGIASGTAFDFLGDGVAEAEYLDEQKLFIFDGATGDVVLMSDRGSPTIVEYPTVVDVDDDGSAEILVVSTQGAPTLQVIKDVDDRWIQARRIWNQHTYHVTNVREDGTIPQFEPPHWELLNTFRTNAQIENGGTCSPMPEG